MLLNALKIEGRGIIPRDLGIAKDDTSGLEEAVLSGLGKITIDFLFLLGEKVDVLITSGGVSMGELDLLKPLFEKYGML
jgi:gephyrin